MKELMKYICVYCRSYICIHGKKINKYQRLRISRSILRILNVPWTCKGYFLESHWEYSIYTYTCTCRKSFDRFNAVSDRLFKLHGENSIQSVTLRTESETTTNKSKPEGVPTSFKLLTWRTDLVVAKKYFYASFS